MPLARRVPKLKGFRPPVRTDYGTVNVAALARIERDEIDPDDLRAAGLVRKRHALVKILGGGEIDRSVVVRGHAFSESARKKIEAAGGTAEVIEGGGAR